MKRWYASKTIWANIIAGIVTLAGLFGLDLGLTPDVQAQIVTGVLAVVNIILRFVTKEPVK
jgi:hypothetical protein